MLLANSSVRETAKTARVCLIRHAPLAASLYSLFIQNHCAKSREAGAFRNELRKCARTSLMGSSFCIGNGEGIEVLAKPIFVRGLPLQWKRAPHRPVPPSLFIQNHCAKSREAGAFRNELRKCARTSLMGSSFCIGNGEGIEVLAKPIFVRGLPLQWKRASHPSMAGAPRVCTLRPPRTGTAASFMADIFRAPRVLRFMR